MQQMIHPFATGVQLAELWDNRSVGCYLPWFARYWDTKDETGKCGSTNTLKPLNLEALTPN